MQIVEDIFDNAQSCKSSVIAVESPLQERIRLLTNLALKTKSVGKKCYLWTIDEDTFVEIGVGSNRKLTKYIVNDYVPFQTKNQPLDYFHILQFWRNFNQEGVFIVDGVLPWLNVNHQQVEAEFFLISEWIKSAIINFSFDNSGTDKLMILLGVNASLSPEIGASIPVVTQKLPTEEQIVCYLEAEFSGFKREDCKSIASTLVGLYIGSIHKIIAATLSENAFTNLRFTKQYLLNKKTEILQKFYGVEFLPPSSIKLGGYELMQEAFRKYKLINTSLGKAYNLSLPKGILLVGPPGTGKSHSAKVCSQILGLPLIVVDWGHFRSYGNAAELKLKNLLALADTINRVILYFDDLDKGFAGGDDLAMRLAGKLLTCMQERTSDVIVFASANRMEVLPPELTRSGRFDEIYQIDLPNNEERYAIFNIHLARFDNRFVQESELSPYTDSEWRRILKATNRCVGAEIQLIVEDAARSTFCKMYSDSVNVPVDELPQLVINLEAILEARLRINPLAIREADKVEAMRNRAAARAKPSSKVDESKFALSNVNIYG